MTNHLSEQPSPEVFSAAREHLKTQGHISLRLGSAKQEGAGYVFEVLRRPQEELLSPDPVVGSLQIDQDNVASLVLEESDEPEGALTAMILPHGTR